MIRVACVLVWSAVGSSAFAQFSNPRPIQEHQTYRPKAFEMVDMNDDGDADAFFITSDGELAWLENDGAGAFPTRHSIASGAEWNGSIAFGDLDGDGDDDVVIALGNQNGLVWCEDLGSGEYAQLVDVASIGLNIHGLDVGDLDGDGDMEIAAAVDATPGFLHIYNYIGNGQFSDSGPLTTTENEFDRLHFVNLDDDDNLDLLVVTQDSLGVFWMQGDGSGNLGPAQQLWSDSLWVQDAEPVDFDQDGDLDLFMVYSTIDDPVLGYWEFVGGEFIGPVVVDTIPPSVYTLNVLANDLDDDGDMDLAGVWNHEVFWYENLSGAFGERTTLSTTPLQPVLRTADLEGDGDMDLFTCSVAEGLVCHFENLGDGSFGNLVPIGRGLGDGVGKQMADLDGDGRKDLVVTSRQDSRVVWFPSDPHKLFEPYIIIDLEATSAIGLAAVDDDEDSDVDLIVGLCNTGELVRYENQGDGTFIDRMVLSDSLQQITDVQVADLDGDGDEDLVLGCGSTTGGVFWMERIGAGFYGSPTRLDPMPFVNYGTTIIDLNGDGFLDIAVASFLEHAVHWYANDGDGSFGPRQTVTANAGLLKFLQASDLDGDGDADLLTQNVAKDMVWYANDGSGTFTLVDTIDPTYSTFDVRAVCADLDMDGDVDIVATYDGDGGPTFQSMVWYPNAGDGSFPIRHVVVPYSQWMGSTVPMDLDSDGDLDIAYSETYKPAVRYLENFILGGARVEGYVYADEDEDGVRDANEPPFPAVTMVSDPEVSAPVTDADGRYRFYLPMGSYTLSPANIPEFWGVSSDSATWHVNVGPLTEYIGGLDIGLAPMVDTTLIEAHIEPLAAPCGGETIHNLILVNHGTTLPDGVLSYVLDGAFDFQYSEPPPDSVVGQTMYWHFEDLPYEEPWSVTCVVINPTSAEILGQATANTLTAISTGNSGPLSFTFALAPFLGCSYDPNDKQVLPLGQGEHGAIPLSTERLTYTVRFQNTGAGTAFGVRLRDRFSEQLDPHSLQLLGSSHQPTDIRVEADGELAVEFENIMLPYTTLDSLASQGYLSFSVAVMPGASHLAQISNTAEIYFDFEPGVTTNTTLNTLVDCEVWIPALEEVDEGILEASAGEHYQWFQDGVLLPTDTLPQLVVLTTGNYTALVTDQYGCAALTSPIQVVITSIVLQDTAAMRVFPNPTNGLTRVLLGNDLPIGEVLELTDVQGRVVRVWDVNGRKELLINTVGLTVGVYVLRLRDDTGIAGAIRLVVQ